MSCFYHEDRPSTSVCNTCGKSLCTECGSVFQPPTCPACAKQHIENTKSEMIKSLVISAVLMVVGLIATQSFSGIFLAGIPHGWKILNRITPAMFLFLPLIGWVIYFFLKLFLSIAIGMFALPYNIYKWAKELSKAKQLEELL